MLLISGRKQDAKMLAKSEWHQWFAWHPVMMRNGDVVWLEKIERRLEFVEGHDGRYVFDRYRWIGDDSE